MSASRAAAPMQPAVPSSSSGARAVAVSNDAMASGPTARCRDVPVRA
jgi:hypothetical protein